MWIINDNEATQSLYSEALTDEDGEPLLDEPVAFSENGTAQVTEAVGEALVAHYDSIRPYEAEDSE